MFVLVTLAALVSSSKGETSYVRREGPADQSAEMIAILPNDARVLASVSSDGDISSLDQQGAKQARVAASLKAYQNSYLEAEAMLEKVRRNDVFDENGFEVQQVPMQQRLAEIRQEKQKQAALPLEMEKHDAERTAAHMKVLREGGDPSQLLQGQEQAKASEKVVPTYDGRDAVVTGFWAKDRPNEERIDPDNMKIYTFKTYSKRFPFTHSWNVEVMWKKLPLAPKKVHRVSPQPNRVDGNASPVLMQGGSVLVDDNMQELVWTKDSNGYYHMGREIPNDGEIFLISHPREAALRQAAQKRSVKKKLSGLYADLSTHIANIKGKLQSSRRIDREDATRRLEHMVLEMQDTLKLQPKQSGKAFISARGADGYLCSFNADIGKVTGRMVKNRIEQDTGIPWEAQQLRIKGKDLMDTELLNVHLGAGRNAWIEVMTAGWDVMQHALMKRGKIEQPAAHRKVDSIEILADTPANSYHMDKASSPDSHISQYSPKPVAVIEDEDDMLETVEDQMFSDDVDYSRHPMVYQPEVVQEEAPAHRQAQVDEMDTQVKAVLFRAMEAQELQKQSEKLAKQAVAPPQHAVVTREMVYAKDDDGRWHVDKVKMTAAKKEDKKQGGPGHHLGASHFQKLWNGVDEGIPVQDRLIEIDDQEPEQLLEVQDQAFPASTHMTKAQKVMADFRKLQKHAQSEEMKWRAKEKKAKESKIAAKTTVVAKPKVQKASLAQDQAFPKQASTHMTKAQKAMKDFRKLQKHAQSGEMKWRAEQKKTQESKIAAKAVVVAKARVQKASLAATKTKHYQRKQLFGATAPTQKQ